MKKQKYATNCNKIAHICSYKLALHILRNVLRFKFETPRLRLVSLLLFLMAFLECNIGALQVDMNWWRSTVVILFPARYGS